MYNIRIFSPRNMQCHCMSLCNRRVGSKEVFDYYFDSNYTSVFYQVSLIFVGTIAKSRGWQTIALEGHIYVYW